MRMTISALVLCLAGSAALAQEQPLGTRISAGHGSYIVDGQGRTLYLFAKDRRGTDGELAESRCTDACASAWPPVIANTPPKAPESASQDLVGTIQRPDGSTQVTYGGWPLYRHVGDAGAGKATGAAFDKPQFGGRWHLVGPGGEPAEQRASGEDPFAGLAFKKPECVRHDPDRGFWLVSNVNGPFTKADNNGFISRIGPGGVSELKWIEGGKEGVTLNAPKGMELVGNRLHVADVDHVRIFHAGTGKPLDAIKIPGAKFLNGIAVAPDGSIFVSDTGATDAHGAIYRIAPDRTVSTVSEQPELKRPNGVALDGEGRLNVVTFDGDELIVLTKEGEIVETHVLPAGQLDGILVRPDGDVLVSSWKDGSIVRVATDGTSETVLTGLKSPACFDVVDTGEGPRLIVPEPNADKVAVAPLTNG
jgi:predicted lipoprotein with Yx(FWY)xxD motif